ncbi:MAG: MFS transporter [Rhodospirillales bacterium]|nr:MFS transporter [Rhodospirillales bacterium]
MVSRRALISWCLYDWANSAFPTVIITFVFATYYTSSVAADKVIGTAHWGYAMSLSALTVAFAAPVFGAIADKGSGRKPWLGFFTALCVILSAALWMVEPNPSYALLALIVAGLANFAFETGMVFYNAMLPGLGPQSHIGRISGWGWGLGYFGGLLCLALTLVGFVQPETPLFGLDKETAEHVRAAAILVAVWYAVFSIPLFLFTPDKAKGGGSFLNAVKTGLNELIATLRQVRGYGDIVRFLIARMIYTDGLNTLFAFGGIYAAGSFGMELNEIIIFAIGMNVTAGIGAAAFGWVDDAIGPKKTIMIALIGLTALSTALLIVEGKTLFWIFGLPLGLFVGPAQAASRSMMARLAPEHLRTEMFGLFAFSGKATAFLGPALLGAVAAAFDSQRAGMATILVFFAVGMILLLRVPES